MKLEGQSALVTGAGKRIGKAIALELARAGADIVVHANSSRADAEQTAAEVRDLGRRAAVVIADQAEVAQIKAACADAVRQFPRLSVLVNSAANWPKVDFLSSTEEDYLRAMDTNLKGPYFWARYLGPTLKASADACIVNIVDALVDRPRPDAIPYAMAKAGLWTMTQAIARALAPNVRVNAVGPGPIIFPSDYDATEAQRDIDATLVRRLGHPDDIARAVRFLCENDYITATFLPVDGGFRFGM